MRATERSLTGLSLLSDLTKRLASGSLYSFTQGLPSLLAVNEARDLVGHEDAVVVRDFESAFAQLVGPGDSVAFASGRMGFFALMKAQRIGPGDEVILPGYTCAVMPNAVLRVGATPVYADISPRTLGSSAETIAPLITSRTRMIVAQHTFGYPCDIGPIAALARDHSVFLLEDCATTLGSAMDGQAVGTFGDAALFSTDHTKPLVTHTGGLIFSQDPAVTEALRVRQESAGVIGEEFQAAMWRRLEKEARLSGPAGQLRLFASDTARGIVQPDALAGAFLSEDFSSRTTSDSYPYPARLPTFLAAIGLKQVAAWPLLAKARRRSLSELLSVLDPTPAQAHLPQVLRDPRADITPLRLAWSQPDGGAGRRSLRKKIATEGTWFRSPISVAAEPMEAFGYVLGSCPESELLGPGMINVPMLANDEHNRRLASFLMARFSD